MSGIRWHNEMKKSILEKGSLAKNSVIICQKLEYLFFAVFPNYIEYARYFQECTYEKRCFFEVIPGTTAQKPFFDIDISDSPLSVEEMNLQIVDFCEAIIETFPFIDKSDIIVCSSHGPNKISYHIIVDNWFLATNEDNKEFQSKVCRTAASLLLSTYVDAAPHSSLQQLRIYGCHKFGTSRTKILDKVWAYHPIHDVDPETPKGLIAILSATVIQNTASCKYAKSLAVQRQKKKLELEEVTEDEIKKITQMFDTTTYSVAGVKDGFLLLKRFPRRHNVCPKCSGAAGREIKHETENPYIFVSGKQRNVYFNCRRYETYKDPNDTSSGSQLIGMLGPSLNPFLPERQEIKEQAFVKEEIIIPKESPKMIFIEPLPVEEPIVIKKTTPEKKVEEKNDIFEEDLGEEIFAEEVSPGPIDGDVPIDYRSFRSKPKFDIIDLEISTAKSQPDLNRSFKYTPVEKKFEVKDISNISLTNVKMPKKSKNMWLKSLTSNDLISSEKTPTSLKFSSLSERAGREKRETFEKAKSAPIRVVSLLD